MLNYLPQVPLRKEMVHGGLSLVTIIGFLTGYESLPEMTGYERAPIEGGVIDAYSGQIMIAVVLVSVPLFNVIDTWLAVSLSRIGVHLLDELGLDQNWLYCLVGFVILLPVVVGTNIIFMNMMLGPEIGWDYLVFISASVIVTAIITVTWFRKEFLHY